MATLSFETLRFSQHQEMVKVVFLKYFYFEIPIEDLLKIGEVTVSETSLTFPYVSEKRAQNKFSLLLDTGLRNLRGIVTGKPTTYIHQNSGIPLVGSRYIGIQDRGTNFLEIKPITGCTLGCVFCSVDEGIGTKKAHDFVVERAYLVAETKKLLDFKQCENIHVYINVHGEPLLYADIVGLVGDLHAIHWIKDVTIITTAVLLTKKLVDDLAAAGLTEINVSISAMNAEQAKVIMGTKAYDIGKIKDIVQYAASTIKTTIAPVWVNDMNDTEMEKIIAFGNSIHVPVRIQKFCHNTFGRNPVEEISWTEFYAKIAVLEEKTCVHLCDAPDAYSLEQTKELQRPFKKNDIIEAQIVSVGRYSHERLCVAKNRLISVPKCRKDHGKTRIRIVQATHNVFVGEQL